MINKKEHSLKLNILHDKVFKVQLHLSSSTTIQKLKSIIVQILGLYSVNYLIEYNDRDYSKFESFTLEEIFLFTQTDKEYSLNLKDIETYVQERRGQRFLISFEEGEDKMFVYNIKTKKFEKMIPDKSSGIKFTKFPFNCRYCHVKKENIIVIIGGIGNENACCSYDYDTNFLMDHPNCKHERQMHSMVNINDDIFVIGGLYSNYVECFNLEFEDWKEYPCLNYDRKDASVCIVDNQFLYVFMGYSQTLGSTAENFERLDISKEAFTAEWQLLPINNPLDLLAIKTHCGVIQYEDGFLFLGGFINFKCDKNVNYFDLNDYSFRRSKFTLPFETAFGEKQMFTVDDKDFYLYTYGSNRIIKFDTVKEILQEVI